MTRITLLICFTLLLYGCTKRTDPTPVQPDPTPEATLSRSFYNQSTNTLSGVRYAPSSVTALTRSDGAAIVFSVSSLPDQVTLDVDRAALSTNWLGTYALRCRPRPTNPVDVSYTYTEQQYGGTSIYLLSTNAWGVDLTGNLTITAYDAARQLVSGTFSVSAPNQLNPLESPGALRGETTLSADGTFTDVKIKPVQ